MKKCGVEDVGIVIVGAKIRIIETFISLLETTKFEKIRVKMIVEMANINRKTFYDYFESKEGLLNIVEDKILYEFKAIFNEENIDYFISNVNNSLEQQKSYQKNTEICQHMKQYRSFYKSRFTDMAFYQKFSNTLNQLLQPYLNNSMISQYLSFGTTGYLSQWLKNDCNIPIEEVAVVLEESGLPSILRAIEK